MPSKTDFADLTLYASTGKDTESTFLSFRTDIAGTSPDSNFNKISSILSQHDQSIKNSRHIFDVHGTHITDNYYEYQDPRIDKYYDKMIIIMSLSKTNAGKVIININSLGNLTVMKYNDSGQLVNLEANDLIQDVKYIAILDNNSFIILNNTIAGEVLEKIKTVDGSGSGLDADLLDGKESAEFAASEQGLKADTAIQSIKGNGTIINPDENKSVNITPESISSVPISRTVNNKSLSENIILSPQDIGAAPSSHSHSNASTSSSGFMSSSDKSELDGIANGATKNVITYGTANPSGGSNGDIYFKYN